MKIISFDNLTFEFLPPFIFAVSMDACHRVQQNDRAQLFKKYKNHFKSFFYKTKQIF